MNLPHINVYIRLINSEIHGVGVFAIKNIPKGTNICLGDKSKFVWINKDDIVDLDEELKQLYLDFCVFKNNKILCPDSFNNLTPSWYINESKVNPNVKCNEDYDFITIRDIMKGEELLADYSTYSDNPEIE